MPKKISVVIADDHPIIRSGLVSLMERNSEYFEVVGEAEAGYNAVNLCIDVKPDVLILDLHMPGDLDGVEVIQAIRRLKLNVKILVFTVDKYPEILLVQELRVDKCLHKATSNDAIIKAIREIVEYSNPEKILSSPIETKPSTNDNSGSQFWFRPLSPRELEVLKAAARGLDKDGIAQQLVMTSGTVGVHLTSIYQKLGVKNRAEAVSFAYRNRLLS